MTRKLIVMICLLLLSSSSLAQVERVPTTDTLDCSQYNTLYAGDTDADGLCDGWEQLWFGCPSADGQAYIRIWDDEAPYIYYDDCQRADLNGDGHLNTVPNLTEFSGIDDPDGDNCNNACEQSNETRPIVEPLDCSGYPSPYQQDSDEDGLCDGWEFRWFGCVSSDYLTYIYPSDGEIPYVYPDDCATANLDGDGIPDIVPNIAQFSGIDDNDGCVNSCEQRNETKPINDNASYDCDGDGVNDYDEINSYLTSASCDDVNPVDGIPDGYDTDNDGLNDGQEIFVYNIHPYGPTNPLNLDMDNDGEPDGYDTDGDGLSDGEEVFGTYQSSPNHVHTDGYQVSGDATSGYTITQIGDGTGDGFDDYTEARGEDRDGNMQQIVTVVNNAPNTNTSNVSWTQIQTDPASMDTDSDGLDDNCEFNPFVCGILGVHPTDPRNPDTDGDNLLDGEEITESDTGYRVAHVFSPNERDWDLDGVTDRDEWQHFSDPRDRNSDSAYETETYEVDGQTIYCSDYLDDYTEIYIFGTNPSAVDYYTIAPGILIPDTPDGNIDGIDSDGDTLSDCEEIFVLQTDPTDWDTDGDAVSDADDPAPLDPIIGDISDYTDDDGDNMPDTWESAYFDEWIKSGDSAYFYPHDGSNDVDVAYIPPYEGWEYPDGTFATALEADPDDDGCDNLCEFQRFLYPNDGDTDDDGLGDNSEPLLATDPRNWDTDGDGLVDSCEIYPNTTVNHPDNAYGAMTCTSSFSATNPRIPDSDDDGLTDFQELYPTANAVNGLDPSGRDTAANLDNYEPSYGAMNPWDADSDDDNLTDYQEAMPSAQNEPYFHTYGASNPNHANTDGTPVDDNDHTADAWSDYEEVVTYGTNPRNPDTDMDGIRDDIEFNVGTIFTDEDVNPADGIRDGWDTDRDGLSDGQEYFGSGYTLPDSSGTPIYFPDLVITFCDLSTQTITLAGYRDDPDNGLNPNNPDSDYDSVDWDGDGIENTSIYYDTDGDTIPDARDFFMNDGDEITGARNSGNPTNPLNFDTDNDDPDRRFDGIMQSDAQELNDVSVATDPLCYNGAGDVDSDGDDLTNVEEINGTHNPYTDPRQDTDPFDPDSDDDLMTDGDEILGVTEFTTYYNDTNGSTVNVSEYPISNPNDPDTDGDGLPDGREWTGYYTGTVFNAQYDGVKTNPLVADTDGDGISDGAEMDLRIETGNNSLFDPLDGEPEHQIIMTVITDEFSPLRDVLYAYWDPTLVDPNGLCPSLCQALVVADSHGYIIRESDNWLRLYFDPIGNGGASTDISSLFDNGQSTIINVSAEPIYEVWIAIPYLAELTFHADIEAMMSDKTLDTNDDGSVTPSDVIFVLNRLYYPPTGAYARADIDSDGDIDTDDAQLVLDELDTLP